MLSSRAKHENVRREAISYTIVLYFNSPPPFTQPAAIIHMLPFSRLLPLAGRKMTRWTCGVFRTKMDPQPSAQKSEPNKFRHLRITCNKFSCCLTLSGVPPRSSTTDGPDSVDDCEQNSNQDGKHCLEFQICFPISIIQYQQRPCHGRNANNFDDEVDCINWIMWFFPVFLLFSFRCKWLYMYIRKSIRIRSLLNDIFGSKSFFPFRGKVLSCF